MESQFWHNKWANNEIGFHTSEANPLLVKHFQSLSLRPAGRVFVPLCGKTLDIHWLLAQGFSVVGAELSPLAIEQLFNELGVTPTITQVDNLVHYAAPNIDIWVGNIFNLTSELLGKVDAIYDRAALVALPFTLRKQYTTHLKTITHTAPQLLICFDYDQTQMEGPPFSIKKQEIEQHYSANYSLTLLESAEVVGKLKGQCEAQENVWLLLAN